MKKIIFIAFFLTSITAFGQKKIFILDFPEIYPNQFYELVVVLENVDESNLVLGEPERNIQRTHPYLFFTFYCYERGFVTVRAFNFNPWFSIDPIRSEFTIKIL